MRLRVGNRRLVSLLHACYDLADVEADALLDSLTDLTSAAKPSDLIPSHREPGFAHDLSKRFIPVPAPSIRGTLDPRRPQAIRDNVTVKPRPVTQPLAGMGQTVQGAMPGTPLSVPPTGHSAYGPSVPPHGTPTRGHNYAPSQTPVYGLAGQANYRPPPTPGYGGYNAPNQGGSPAYGRTGPVVPSGPPQQVQYVRPGPGPSALRQSFGPGNGSPYGRNPAAGLMSQVVPQYRM